MEALRGATISGMGIGCRPDFLARDPLADCRLRTVLDAHMDAPAQFHLLWPSNRHLSPKVRVLVDFLSEKLFSLTTQSENQRDQRYTPADSFRNKFQPKTEDPP